VSPRDEASRPPSTRSRVLEICLAALLLAVWLALMLPLARWGLPSRANDDLLFGGEAPWSAERFAIEDDLAARRSREAGADTDLDAVGAADEIVDLTESDADRAAILRRYRLFTRQPDEMITFMALQRMNPRAGDFDPKLYQYGGAYIYLIGAAVGAASAVGLVDLPGGAAYLEEPELFGAAYFTARAVTLLFGAALLVAAALIARHFGGRAAAWLAPLIVAAAPVFLSDALEAKPHLPSACMALWATWFALRFAETKRTGHALGMGLCSGLAFGLVLTGAATAALWMPLIASATRGRSKWAPLALAAGLAVLVYALTNPFVVWNVLAGAGALSSNLENSTAMYTLADFPVGVRRVGQLLVESGGPGLCFVGAWSLLWLCGWRSMTHVGLLTSAAAALALLCAAIGAGKPAEFSRFLLLPTAVLAIAAAAYLAAKLRTSWLLAGGLAAALFVPMNTAAYLRSFYNDAGSVRETRRTAAGFIQQSISPDQPIGVVQEPAPYSIPPLDFTRRRVLLLPRAAPVRPQGLALPDWLVLTGDDLASFDDAWWRERYELFTSFGAERRELSRITWADKPVYLMRLVRSAPAASPGGEAVDH